LFTEGEKRKKEGTSKNSVVPANPIPNEPLGPLPSELYPDLGTNPINFNPLCRPIFRDDLSKSSNGA
jgi:hypothetical protein